MSVGGGRRVVVLCWVLRIGVAVEWVGGWSELRWSSKCRGAWVGRVLADRQQSFVGTVAGLPEGAGLLVVVVTQLVGLLWCKCWYALLVVF